MKDNKKKFQKTIVLIATGVFYLLPLNCIADTTRDHRTQKETNVRDHRTTNTSNVRDHRTPKQSNVRDHRTEEQVKQQLSFKIPKYMQNKTPVIQWMMKADRKGRSIQSGKSYQLVNIVNDRGIKRQKRVTAANLGFLSSSSKKSNLLIKRKKGQGQVRYGDIVALNLKPYGWLKYKKQRHGINISDDNHRPHYIWKIRGGQTGTKLVSGMPFALYNTSPTIKSEMIFCKRTYGIDLGWYPSSKCNTFSSRLSGTLFGDNGFLSYEGGYSPKSLKKMKDYVCKTAVSALQSGINTATKGTPVAAIVNTVAPYSIKTCKRF